MTTGLLIDVVVMTWLGCIGFARLPSAYARLHCVAFVAFGAGLPLTLESFFADGASSRALKVLLLLVLVLVCGAALSHATGRAIALHTMDRKQP